MEIADLRKIQVKILTDLSQNIRFLNRITYEVHKNARYLEENRALGLIRYNSMRIIILEISKLLNPNEDFSLYQFYKLNPLADKTVSQEINKTKLRNLKNELKQLQKEFKNLDIPEVRNEYVAHLDKSGNEYNLTVQDLSRLIDKIIELFNKIENELFNSKTIFKVFDEDISRAVKVFNQHKEIFRIVRKAFHENEDTISRKKIWDVFKFTK